MKVFSFIWAVLFLCACDNTDELQYTYKFPDTGDVSYYSHVRPFLQIRCGNAGCHSSTYQAGGRVMTDYFSLFSIQNTGLIVAGDTISSVLAQVMDGRNQHLYILGLVMPTQNQQDGMKRWIAQGAPNN